MFQYLVGRRDNVNGVPLQGECRKRFLKMLSEPAIFFAM